VREVIYGLIIGAGLMFAYEYLDAPAIWAYLTGATEYATKSVSGYR
jgi:hypothetical protein